MKVLTAAQEEQIKEIGSYLRQVREQNSVSIAEIAAKTHIRLVLLQALEAGNLEQLPEPIFVQGFIRRYGEALGLDGATLAKSFPNPMPSIEPDPRIIQHGNSIKDVAHQPTTRKIPAYLPVGLGIVAVVGGLLLMFKQFNWGNASQLQNATVVKSQLATVPAQAQPPKPTAPVYTQPQAPIKVTVELKGDSWVRVVADGNTRFEGTMNKGKKQTWAAKRQLTLRVGNAGVVFASLNQQPAKVMGDVGEIEEISYKPEL